MLPEASHLSTVHVGCAMPWGLTYHVKIYCQLLPQLVLQIGKWPCKLTVGTANWQLALHFSSWCLKSALSAAVWQLVLQISSGCFKLAVGAANRQVKLVPSGMA